MNNTQLLKILTDQISDMPDDEVDDLLEKLRSVKGKYVLINTGEKKYKIPTEHVYLEIERLRKNDILKDSINNLIKVKGTVSGARIYRNTAIFCLSPCKVGGKEIGHTWVRYSPSFKGIRLGSTVTFYSQAVKYRSNSKSGVDWNEASCVKITGGDNTPLHCIPLKISIDRRIKDNAASKCVPGDITLWYSHETSLKSIRFYSDPPMDIVYKPLRDMFIVNGEYEAKGDWDKDQFLLFEWLAKLEDWEFWHFVNRA